jgi:TP901 family phage tail tape measure protein
MAGVTVAELIARLRADTRGFSASMAKARAEVKGLEGSTSQFGSRSSAAFKAFGAAAAVGVALSVAEFIKFEETMTRTMTLAGSSRDEMERLSKEILDVSVGLGTSPNELAEALYFTESAGIAASDAMEVVTASAKASAIGLGETEVVADAVTSVLNAYGQENITAAQATDTLVAAVKTGKGEADAIAGAIGRVIPIASEMGISFDQVAAAIAALTRTGLDANEAVTSLRGIMTALLDPSDRAREAMEGVGLSAEGIRASIEDNGLLATLTMLKTELGADDEAMARLFPEVRGLVGVMSLLGKNADGVADVFDQVTNATGSLDEAFAVVEQTAGFKIQQALAGTKVAMIEVGGAVAPLVSLLADLVQVITPLLPLIVKVGVAFFAWKAIPIILAAVDAALISTGRALAAVGAAKVADGIGNAGLAVGKLSNAVAAIPGVWKAAAVAVGIGAFALFKFMQRARELELGKARAEFHALSDEVVTAGTNMRYLTKQITYLPLALSEAGNAAKPVAKTIVEDFAKVTAHLDDIQLPDIAVGTHEDQMDAFTASIQRGGEAVRELSSEEKLVNEVLRDNVLTFGEYVNVANQLGESFVSNEDFLATMKEMAPAVLKGKVSQEAWNAALDEANDRGLPEAILLLGQARAEMELMATATANADKMMSSFDEGVGQMGGKFSNLASIMGVPFKALVDRIALAREAGGDVMKSLTSDIKTAVAEWTADIAAGFDGVGSALSQFSGETNVSMSDLNAAMKTAADSLETYQRDWQIVSRRAGADADFVRLAIAEMGLDGKGALHALAGASEKEFGRFVTNAQRAEGSQKTLVQVIQEDLIGVLRDLISWIKRIPDIKPKANTGPAVNDVQRLIDKLREVDGMKATATVAIQQILAGRGGGPAKGVDTGHAGGLVGGEIRHTGGFAGPWGWKKIQSNEVPAILQKGEYVIRRAAARTLGLATLSRLNRAAPGRPLEDMLRARRSRGDRPMTDVFGIGQGPGGGRGGRGAFRTMAQVLRHFRRIIQDVTTRKEAAGWERRMRQQLATPGVSRIQRQLVATAMKAVQDATTKGEAKGARIKLARAISAYEYGAHPFTQAGPNLSFVIRPDRRRFNRDLDYDALLRGQ